jgi:hypothetical protein
MRRDFLFSLICQEKNVPKWRDAQQFVVILVMNFVAPDGLFAIMPQQQRPLTKPPVPITSGLKSL